MSQSPAMTQPSTGAKPSPMITGLHPATGTPIKLYAFDGGAGSYLGTAIAGFLVTVLTLGICLPWAIVMKYRWQAKHTYLNGHRLRFTGTAPGLFGQWIKWWFFTIITVGIYLFWVVPRLTKWVVEHQEFDATFRA
jgi:uncharacterized membrane protein YjgN (DUF898 family)